jgi:hypothetical protein
MNRLRTSEIGTTFDVQNVPHKSLGTPGMRTTEDRSLDFRKCRPAEWVGSGVFDRMQSIRIADPVGPNLSCPRLTAIGQKNEIY